MFSIKFKFTTNGIIKYALSLNPVTFVNYYNFDNKYGILNLGLNPEISGNVNKHYISVGAILGNSYPTLPFTKYYMGYDYKLKNYNLNLELLFNSKISIMRYKNKVENTLLNLWEEYGIFNGLTLQKKIKKPHLVYPTYTSFHIQNIQFLIIVLQSLIVNLI
jgi:hypothetical protein